MSHRAVGFMVLGAVCTLSLRTAFVGGQPMTVSPATRSLSAAAGAPRLGAGAQQPQATSVAAAVVGGCVALALGAAQRQAQRLAGPRKAAVRVGGNVARRAEGSLLDSFKDEDDAIEQENKRIEEETALELTGDNIDASVGIEEESAGDAAKRGARQISYNLYPSRQYVLYIAKKNAQRTWTKDGPDGTNIGCIEVQIAIATEKIRSMVLHCREFTHDFKCRLKLVSLVARRRRLLDKLAVKDLEAYLKVREELKIRHVYRMEALIGRLPAYRYTVRDRKQAPGRKVAMRLKKSKRLLNRRLATQLRQGKSRMVIHKTKKQIASRKWLSRAYDEVESLVAGQQPTEYVDPLNMP